jgi:amino acid transporter
MPDAEEIIGKTAMKTKKDLEESSKKLEIPLACIITVGLALFSYSSFKSGSPITGWAFLVFALVNVINVIIKISWRLQNRAGRGSDNTEKSEKAADKQRD